MTNSGRIDCLNCSFDELLDYIEQKLRKGDSKEANTAIAYCRGRISVVEDKLERELLEKKLKTLLSKVKMTTKGGSGKRIDFSSSKKA